MTLRFLGHVRPSVPWPFDSTYAIINWWSIETDRLSPAVFEIFGCMCICVTTLTFQAPVRLLLTWSPDLQVEISFKCYNVTSFLSLSVLERMGHKYIGVMTFNILGGVASWVTWLFESPYVISYWFLHWNWTSILLRSTQFRHLWSDHLAQAAVRNTSRHFLLRVSTVNSRLKYSTDLANYATSV